MILELVAELLAGETLVTSGGAVDSATAAAADVELWGLWRPAGNGAEPATMVETGEAIEAGVR